MGNCFCFDTTASNPVESCTSFVQLRDEEKSEEPRTLFVQLRDEENSDDPCTPFVQLSASFLDDYWTPNITDSDDTETSMGADDGSRDLSEAFNTSVNTAMEHCESIDLLENPPNDAADYTLEEARKKRKIAYSDSLLSVTPLSTCSSSLGSLSASVPIHVMEVGPDELQEDKFRAKKTPPFAQIGNQSHHEPHPHHHGEAKGESAESRFLSSFQSQP